MMNRKWIAFIMVVAAMVISCGKEVDQTEIIGTVAKQYYQYLLEGKYEEFVDGHYQPDSIPGVYREQLVANAKMFVGQQKEAHHGMMRFDVVKVNADTARHVANVFLSVAYGDSTSEEIVVPMVCVKGNWMMK